MKDEGGGIHSSNQTWHGRRFTFVFKKREVDKTDVANAIALEVRCTKESHHHHTKCRKRLHFSRNNGREGVERWLKLWVCYDTECDDQVQHRSCLEDLKWSDVPSLDDLEGLITCR